ncbi:hypothetical protein ALC56_12352, partial [Trachymyrmex septentrionalis]
GLKWNIAPTGLKIEKSQNPLVAYQSRFTICSSSLLLSHLSQNRRGEKGRASSARIEWDRCSWRNVRREKEAKRQCLESRIDLIEDSTGILLQASLSTAQDSRTCPDCGPVCNEWVSQIRRVCSMVSNEHLSFSSNGYAIELDVCRYRRGHRTKIYMARKEAGKEILLSALFPSALVIAIESDANSRRMLGDIEKGKEPFSQADKKTTS